MKNLLMSVAVAAALGMSINAQAQAPAGAPPGSTALCKDGSYYSGANKKGACAGHKGIKDWYGAGAAASAPAAMAPATASAPKAAAPTAPASPAAPAAETKTAAAPGGGPGKVWANSSTKVYHCPSDRYYGKTKSGEYMSESDAKAKGYKPDHGKACS